MADFCYGSNFLQREGWARCGGSGFGHASFCHREYSDDDRPAQRVFLGGGGSLVLGGGAGWEEALLDSDRIVDWPWLSGEIHQCSGVNLFCSLSSAGV